MEEWHALIPDYEIDPAEPLVEHGWQLGLDALPLRWNDEAVRVGRSPVDEGANDEDHRRRRSVHRAGPLLRRLDRVCSAVTTKGSAPSAVRPVTCRAVHERQPPSWRSTRARRARTLPVGVARRSRHRRPSPRCRVVRAARGAATASEAGAGGVGPLSHLAASEREVEVPAVASREPIEHGDGRETSPVIGSATVSARNTGPSSSVATSPPATVRVVTEKNQPGPAPSAVVVAVIEAQTRGPWPSACRSIAWTSHPSCSSARGRWPRLTTSARARRLRSASTDLLRRRSRGP